VDYTNPRRIPKQETMCHAEPWYETYPYWKQLLTIQQVWNGCRTVQSYPPKYRFHRLQLSNVDKSPPLSPHLVLSSVNRTNCELIYQVHMHYLQLIEWPIARYLIQRNPSGNCVTSSMWFRYVQTKRRHNIMFLRHMPCLLCWRSATIVLESRSCEPPRWVEWSSASTVHPSSIQSEWWSCVLFFSWPGEKLHITNNKTVIVWNSYYDGPQILHLQSANITNSEVVQLKPPQLTGLTQLQIYCLIVTSKGWIACHIFSKMRGYGRYVNLPQVLPLPAFVGLGPCSSAPNGMLLFSIVKVQPTLQKTWADS
jgi:hypothetical protein